MIRRIRQTWSFPGPTIIGYAFFVQNGGWKSIYQYFRQREQHGLPVRLIDRRNPRTRRQLLAAAIFGRHLIFNGLDCFWRWEALLVCLLRPNTAVYLHDTAYMLDAFARDYPLRHRLLARILRRNPVLCVSRAAESLYLERYGATRTTVVYETLAPRPKPDFAPGSVHIVMVGMLDPRKGVDLFSDLADLARARGRSWTFHWLGGVGSREPGKRPESVRWPGWVHDVDPFPRAADLFFLASADDPFPLSCLEALRACRRCVVYAGTGLAEVIDNLPGCAVYHRRDPEDALSAIDAALAAEPVPADYDRIARDHYNLDGFAQRVDDTLGLPRAKE